MGFLDNLFGPSIYERVAPYFTEGNYSLHERILTCVRTVEPTLKIGKQMDEFYKVVESFITKEEGDNEMISLFHAAMLGGGGIVTTAAMQRSSGAKWEMVILSDVPGRKNSTLRLFGKYRNKGSNGSQVWMSLDDDGKPMASMFNTPDWERII